MDLTATDLQHLMSAPVEALTDDDRRVRWQTLEAHFEDSERQAAAALAKMQAFARRCFEIDEYRASTAPRYRIMGVLVVPR